MGLFKRGEQWWACWSVNGCQYRESAKTADRSTAEQFLESRLGTIRGPVQKRGPNTGVYFVRSRVTGLIKIGCALDITRRVEALKHWSSDDLELIDCLRILDYKTAEAIAHAYFKEHRVRQEWFRITAQQVADYLDPKKPVAQNCV